ncbi:hydrogenase expression protein [Photobacterium leiognathi]|uniref:hydrogenase expression protein n=1 Tax=Photobacterium leiognathi TaxID=553611 RepID=UPI0029813BFF|nr:hydrogenase expression protein [Photobacterium leiognathi]
MLKSKLCILITIALSGSPLLIPTTVNAAVSSEIQSGSLVGSINVDVGQWYSNTHISITNTTNQVLELADMEVWLSLDKEASINSNPWGTPNFKTIKYKDNNFIFKHDSSSLKLAPGSSISLTVGINATNGDSINKNDLHITKITVKNDPGVKGEIEIKAPTSPDKSLRNASILVTGKDYKQTVSIPFGESYSLKHVPDGNYQIKTLDLSNSTGIAKAESPIQSVQVDSNKEAPSINIAYNSFIYYADISLSTPSIEDIKNKVFTNVTVKESGTDKIERVTQVSFGKTVDIDKLLDGHSYDLLYSATVINNKSYQPKESDDISVYKDQPAEITPEIIKSSINTDGFRTVETAITGLPDNVFPLELTLVADDDSMSYTYQITRKNFKLPDNVKPGTYKVIVPSITQDKVRYAYNGKPDVVVTSGNGVQTLNLSFKEAVSLIVRGFPDYVANGTVTNDSKGATQTIGSTKVNAIFKYAGISGSGDPGVILAQDKLALKTTYENAQKASENSGQHILPVMVVYTSNASGGGNSWGDMTDKTLLYKHYATFITQAITAQEYADGDGSSPMSFVLNPDYLGELEKNKQAVEDLSKPGAIDVNAQLKNALDYMKKTYNYQAPVAIPTFGDNLKGYISSLNFIMSKLAKDVTYGWEINLWSTGTADWVHSDQDESKEKASEVSNFINSLGIYSGEYKPDYIAFDKYERDGFGPDAIGHYAFNATSWQRYLSYVKGISDGVQSPAMLWQIPGGHMPTETEGNSLISADHEASGGTFFMGDNRIGTDINSIRGGLLDKELASSTYGGASNVRELLQQDHNYDWSQAVINELPNYNVFAVLWGGGSTTGVVSIGSNGDDHNWLDNKVSSYSQSPECTMANTCDGTIWGGGGNKPHNLPPVINGLNEKYEVNSSEKITIQASATDPEGHDVSYQWTVPNAVTVLSSTASDTLELLAPKADHNESFPISLTVSDGTKNAEKTTELDVIAQGGLGNVCKGIQSFLQGQYKPGQEVTYKDGLYKAERWTDATSVPTTPYSGWKFEKSCSN